MLSAVCSHSLVGQPLALHAEGRRAGILLPLRHAFVHDQACSSQVQALFVNARRCRPAKRGQTLQRAASQDASGSDTSGDFDLSQYVEAKVDRGETLLFSQHDRPYLGHSSCFVVCTVERTKNDASSSMLLLKILDGRGCILPVFIGENLALFGSR